MQGEAQTTEIPIPGWIRPLKTAESGLYWIEQSLLVLLMAILVGLAFSQAALSVLFRLGWSWAGDAVGALNWSQGFLRHVVLLIAFLGASLATRGGRHLAIDAAPKLLSPRARVLLKGFIDLVSAVVCGLLAHATWLLIQTEESVAFRLGGLEVSTRFYFGLILAGFLIIGLRFVVRGTQDFWHGWTGHLEPEAPPV